VGGGGGDLLDKKARVLRSVSSRGRPAAMTAEMLSSVVVPICVILMMTAVGLNLSPAALRETFRRPRSLVLATALQIVLLPAAVLAMIAVLRPDPVLALVLLAIAICPGGAMSNAFTHLVGGNLALSVMMTTVTTLLVSVTAPATVAVVSATGFLDMGGTTALDPVSVASDLLRVTLLPICLGFIIARLAPRLVARSRGAVDLACMIAVAAVIVSSAIVSWPEMEEALTTQLVPVAALSVLSLAVGAAVSILLPVADRTACVIEFAVRNLPVALLLASGSNPSPTTVAVLLCYFLLNASILTTFAVVKRSVLSRRTAKSVDLPENRVRGF
jgi:bile acid:Na+ symporter, BASS family